jgi:hypothetical protein
MRRMLVVCALLTGLSLHAGSGWAHDASPAPAASASLALTRALDGLTLRLVDLQGQHKRAMDPEGRKNALRDLLAVASARQQRLAALIEDDPGAVIKAAMSASARAALPAEALRYVEEDVTLEGELDVLHEDYASGGRYVHWLKLGGARLSVNFAAQAPPLQSGDRVRVRALRVQHALAVGDGSQVEMLAAMVGNTFGAQKTAVILVAFSNQPGVSSTTAPQAQAVVFGAATSVTNFFYEASYQQTSLTGNVFGPYTISISSTGCDYYGIALAAEQAATAAGVSLSSYTRRVYAFPSNGCAWWGLGTVGGYPSMAWINGSFQNGVVAHEMGHNLGLYHSHSLECGAATIAASCNSVDYGDILDVMGSAVPPKHFNAAQKERLGWLGYGASPPITTVQSTGVYTIDPYESMGSAPKALKVLSSAGDWYYVEYRQPIGFDASTVTGNLNVRNGVVVHLMDGTNANGIYLLDMTPATSAWTDPALGVNQSFVDVAGGITISPQWTDGTNAGVNITLGPSACVRQNPSVVISPAQQQGTAPVGVTYVVSVTNNDTGCAASSFAQAVTVPSGWIAVASGLLSIGSGASASTTLSLTAPASVSPGSYTIVSGVSNSSAPPYAGSGSATYLVLGSCQRRDPTVSVSPAMQQGAPGATVTYGVSVTNNDSACGSTSFNQSATVPSGWTATPASAALSINSGATASTTVKVKASASAAPGTYSVVSRATNAVATTFVGSASATYQVPIPCVRKAPTLTVSPVQQQGAPNVPLTYTVSVTNNDTGCASSSFSESVTAPTGWTAAFGVATLSPNPGATLATTLSVKPPAFAAAGTYSIISKATNTAAVSFVSSATATYVVIPGGGGGPAVAVTFSDDFARDDAATVGNGWAEATGDFSVTAGELRSGPTRALHMAVLPPVAGSKERVAASFASTDNGYSPRFGLIMRYRDALNYYVCYRMAGGTSVLRISKVVNGLETVLKSAPVANPAKDAKFRLTCSAESSTLTLELGSSSLTASDSSFSSGSVGLVMGSAWLLGGNGPSHRADDFTASAQ